MDEIAMYAVVKRLIGRINPVGDSQIDEERLKNLKMLTYVVENLITDMDDLQHQYKDCHEHSIKVAVAEAARLTKTIKEQWNLTQS